MRGRYDFGSSIPIADNGWIGLGASAGRIEFDDQTKDEINFLDCRLGVNTQTPNTDYLMTLEQIASGEDYLLCRLTDGSTTSIRLAVDSNDDSFLKLYDRNGASVLELNAFTSTGNVILLPQVNSAAAPTLAFGDGNTGFYEASDNQLYLSRAGSAMILFGSATLQGAAAGPSLNFGDPTSTYPTLSPSKDHTASGLGANAANEISVICNGAECARVDASATATHTRLLVYDVDNATVERVTVGAADSGGANFKVLRIPN